VEKNIFFAGTFLTAESFSRCLHQLKIVMMFSGGLLQMIYVKKFLCILRGGSLFYKF